MHGYNLIKAEFNKLSEIQKENKKIYESGSEIPEEVEEILSKFAYSNLTEDEKLLLSYEIIKIGEEKYIDKNPEMVNRLKRNKQTIRDRADEYILIMITANIYVFQMYEDEEKRVQKMKELHEEEGIMIQNLKELVKIECPEIIDKINWPTMMRKR